MIATGLGATIGMVVSAMVYAAMFDPDPAGRTVMTVAVLGHTAAVSVMLNHMVTPETAAIRTAAWLLIAAGTGVAAGQILG